MSLEESQIRSALWQYLWILFRPVLSLGLCGLLESCSTSWLHCAYQRTRLSWVSVYLCGCHFTHSHAYNYQKKKTHSGLFWEALEFLPSLWFLAGWFSSPNLLYFISCDPHPHLLTVATISQARECGPSPNASMEWAEPERHPAGELCSTKVIEWLIPSALSLLEPGWQVYRVRVVEKIAGNNSKK